MLDFITNLYTGCLTPVPHWRSNPPMDLRCRQGGLISLVVMLRLWQVERFWTPDESSVYYEL